MAEKPKPQPVRGVYENPPGSDIWWIHYYDHGRRHRERVGTHANAVKLYQKRKTQILLGDKLPELKRKRVTLGELITDAIAFAEEHNSQADAFKIKGELLRAAFGTREAEEIKPDEIASWIRRRNVTPATFNRYRSFLSVCYREGIRHGKVKTNPARMLQQKREPTGRKNYLTRDEYERVLTHLRTSDPDRVPGFIISVQTGMRLSEQFGLKWRQVDMQRREINLKDTKNGEDRTIPMTSAVYEVFHILRPLKPKLNSLVFPRKKGGKGIVAMRWFNNVMAHEDIQIDDYTWHNNRHTFCSWLAIAGVPLRTIQELAGHKTIAITARYAHLSPDHKGSEIEKLVSGGKPKLVEMRTATKTAIG